MTGLLEPGYHPHAARLGLPPGATATSVFMVWFGRAVSELLGPDYDPHAGAAALHREAAFYRWCAAGNDPYEFAAWIAEGHADTETAIEPLEGER